MLAFEESNFINIGERCNVAGSTVFKKHIMNDNFAVSTTVFKEILSFRHLQLSTTKILENMDCAVYIVKENGAQILSFWRAHACSYLNIPGEITPNVSFSEI